MNTTVAADNRAVLKIDRDGKLAFTRDLLRGVSVTVLGRKGSGKSTTVAVFAEELLKQGVVLAIIDPQDEYYTLAQAFDILVAGRSVHASIQLDPEKAGALAEFSLRHNLPVVLSLGKYDDEERFTLLKRFFERLWILEEDYKKPYFVLCEEAHTYLPQVGTTPVFAVLSKIFLQGRKLGLGTILATQRSQKIHKDTISQSEIFVLHKVGIQRDIEVYEDLLPVPPKEVRAMVARLRKGSAIVKYEDDTLPEEIPNDVVVRVQIRPQETSHAGATPTFEGPGPVTLRQVDESVLVELRRLLAETHSQESAGEAALKQRVAAMEGALAEKEQALESLSQEVAKRDALIADLEKRVNLLSKLTVTFTGAALPEVATLLPAASLSVEQARVGRVTLEEAGGPGFGMSGPGLLPVEAQELVEAIAQRLAEIVQSDALIQGLREDLARYASQDGQAAAEVGDQVKTEGGVLTLPQQRKLKGLITRLQKLSRFQRCLLRFLIEREGREFSYEELSRELRYMLSTVRGESTTALQREGLIRRANAVLGYTSGFTDYCRARYPGADVGLVREQLLGQLALE